MPFLWHKIKSTTGFIHTPIMLKKILFPFLLLSVLSLVSPELYAQAQVGLKTVEISGEKKINEREIEVKAYELLNSDDDESKEVLNQELKDLLLIELNKIEAQKHTFSQIKSISILAPHDSSFLLFNWNIPFKDGTYQYECGILTRNTTNNNPFIFLRDTVLNDDLKEKSTTISNTWMPRLFYQLIESKTNFQTYYTLLAWDGNNLLTNKKSIEVLWFDKAGVARFGAPIFKYANAETKTRVEFEYGGQNRMKLQYNQALNRIEFDHLSPPSNNLIGIYEYYGADLSFDGFVWDGKNWIYHADINLDEGLNKKKSDFKIDKDLIKGNKQIYNPKK